MHGVSTYFKHMVTTMEQRCNALVQSFVGLASVQSSFFSAVENSSRAWEVMLHPDDALLNPTSTR